MSVYQQLRFKEVILDLSTRPDIVSWLDVVNSGNTPDYLQHPGSTPKDNIEAINILPEELKEYVVLSGLPNYFEDDLERNIFTYDTSKVVLDICIGTKNRSDELEHLVLFLAPYITSGKIFNYHEYIIEDLDYRTPLVYDIMDNKYMESKIVWSENDDEDMQSIMHDGLDD